MPGRDSNYWTDRVAEALNGYSQEMVRSVSYRLLRNRSEWPIDELIDRVGAAVNNAATIDRRIKELPVSARKALALMHLSRTESWPMGRLISMLATLGHAEGLTPVRTLLEEGLVFPDRPRQTPKLRTFEQWLGSGNVAHLRVFAHPQVSARARTEELDLPELPGHKPTRQDIREADGLEWPLRLALIWQQVHDAPLRRTTQLDFFKRDLQRMADDPLINAPFVESSWPIPDGGPLAVQWAAGIGLLDGSEADLRAGTFPEAWSGGLAATVAELWQALVEIEAWDPDSGWLPVRETANPFPSIHLPLLLLLARQPVDRWVHPDDIAGWIVTHHPFWRGSAPESVHGWLSVVLFGLMFQLKLLQCTPADTNTSLVRLSPLGRWLAGGNATPPKIDEHPQSLMVQGNFEILAFRQGLTPALIAALTRFARWKSFGPACQLELIAEHVYRGLESGLSHDAIRQVLQRHGMRPLPDNVGEALRTWSNKRERIVVYGEATLLEFESAADLDAAVARGLVEAKVTDRIGLVRNEDAIDYRQLRLLGTRDFAAKPERCLKLDEDGVTFQVDAARSDLLLETELGQVAAPLNGVESRDRIYRLTRQSLLGALDRGMSLAALDEWMTLRSGEPLSAAARLLAAGAATATFQIDRCIVLKTPTPEIADGLLQLQSTRGLIRERLGPQALLVAEEDVPHLRHTIEGMGQIVEEQ